MKSKSGRVEHRCRMTRDYSVGLIDTTVKTCGRNTTLEVEESDLV